MEVILWFCFFLCLFFAFQAIQQHQIKSILSCIESKKQTNINTQDIRSTKSSYTITTLPVKCELPCGCIYYCDYDYCTGDYSQLHLINRCGNKH